MEFDSDDTEIDTEIASTIDSRAGSTLPIVTGHLGKSWTKNSFPFFTSETTRDFD